MFGSNFIIIIVHEFGRLILRKISSWMYYCSIYMLYDMVFNVLINGQGEIVEREEEDSPLKKCRSWAFEYLEDQREEEHRTLELFPLHPEGRRRGLF